MAVRTITTRLAIDGEKDFKNQMAEVNSNLKTLKSELQLNAEEFKGNANSMDALTKKGSILQNQLDQQKEKVRALEDAVRDSSAAFGENDTRTDKYRQSLNYARRDLARLENELDDNSKYLDEAKRSADHAATSIDEFGKSVKEAGNEAGDFKGPMQALGGSLDDLVGRVGGLGSALAGGAIIGGLTSLKGAIEGVVDESEEYRKIMGTLEVSSAAAGYTTEETAQTFDRLYSVLGDTQAAATTTANLQAIGLSQEELMMVTDSAIGAWAKYGDSIPIDGLAESINETIQAGQVTGTFADVLNWAGTSEDDFNEKLADCHDATERANLVMAELANQRLPEAAESWTELNQDIVASNQSQQEFEEAQAVLGEKLVPVRNFLRNAATEGFLFLADAVDSTVSAIKSLVSWYNNLTDKLNQSGMERMQAGIDKMNARAASGGGRNVDGSHAAGLDRVPFDGYVAELHRDETVLNAQEAQLWRSMRSDSDTSGQPTAPLAVAAPQAAAPQTLRASVDLTINTDWAEGARQMYKLNIQQGGIHGRNFVEVTEA